MSNKERSFLIFVLLVISLTVSIDLITDSREGVSLWHLFIEGTAAAFALLGVFYLIKDSFSLKRDLKKERVLSHDLRQTAEEWRSKSARYLEGLSKSIEEQLSQWHLTPAEKEVAFLLLKGMSLKEIAAIRETSEKTARAQSVAIYSKAGLSGRSELSAFFLEDLLLPSQHLE